MSEAWKNVIIDMLRTVIKQIEIKEVDSTSIIRLNTIQHLLLNIFAKAKVDESEKLVPGRIHENAEGDKSIASREARSDSSDTGKKGYSFKEGCCKRLRSGAYNREKAS